MPSQHFLAGRNLLPQLILLLSLLCITAVSHAAPLSNYPLTVTQPDGTVLKLLASGDEYFNYLHDKNGYVIKQDPKTGFYVYVTTQHGDLVLTSNVVGRVNPKALGIAPNLRISKEQYQERVNAEKEMLQRYGAPARRAPSIGSLNNIVIFIRFSDQAEYTDAKSLYQDMFNNATAGASSQHNYYKEVSYNQMNLNTTFYPTTAGSTVVSYQDSHPRSYYMPQSATETDGYTDADRKQREDTLLKNAVQAVISQIPTSLNVDGDSDGYVDNVCFIIAGEPTAWATLLWPHMSQVVMETIMINGKRVNTYNFQLNSQLTGNRSVGVLCHEMFHSMGGPDFYHYNSSAQWSQPAYKWDLMERDLDPPEHLCAYQKYMYGHWINNIPEITTSGTYTLNPLTSSTGNCYKIKSPSSTLEYFIVEYRKQAGAFESSVPGSGLIVWRINPTPYPDGNRNGPPDEAYVYRPGGTTTADGDPDNAFFNSSVGRTAFNDTTDPSCFLYDGMPGGLRISNIGAAGATISFTVTLGNGSSARQPDAMVGVGGSLLGNNVYNATGADQTKTSDVYPYNSKVYDLRVQNDGTSADTFKITGQGNSTGWTVQYLVSSTGADITSQVIGTSGYTTASLPANSWFDLRMVVTPTESALTYGAMKEVVITTRSNGDTTKADVIKTQTTYTRDMATVFYESCEPQPTDAWQQQGNTSTYGWYVATSDYNDQTPGVYYDSYAEYASSPPHCLAIADPIYEQLDCKLISPSITLPGATTIILGFYHTYQIEYGDGAVLEISNNGGLTYTDLSSHILQGGYDGTIPSGYGNVLAGRQAWSGGAIGPMTLVRVDLSSYHGQTILLRWRMSTDTDSSLEPFPIGWYIDDIYIVADAQRQVDGLVRNNADTTFIGDNVYTIGLETKTQTVAAGGKATYYFKVQNDGNVSDSIYLHGGAGGDGWTVNYFENETSNVTSYFTDGVSINLGPGASATFKVEVTATSPTTTGKTVDVLMQSNNAPRRQDTVRMQTNLNVVMKPDLMIKNSPDSAYIGDNIYNVEASQTKAQTKRTAEAAIYHVKIQNDGQVGDTFKITGTAGGSGWTVNYFDAVTGGNNITTAVTSTAGWSTGSMATNAVKEIRVEVTGDGTIHGGTTKTVRVTATSVADATKVDTVRADTTKAALASVTLAASPISPRITNTLITLTGTAVGGGALEYMFRTGYLNSGVYTWSFTRTWSTSPTCTWQPGLAKTYRVEVYARETGTTPQVTANISYQINVPMSAVNLTTDVPSPRPINTSIRLTGVATGGAVVEYKFRVGYVENSVWTWTTLRGYSTYPSSVWKPTVARTYTLQVWAREQGSTASYQKLKSISYVIKPALTAVSVSASPVSPQPVNTAIVLTATKTGGANVQYQYRVGYNNNGTWSWTVIRPYGTSPTCTWTPTIARTYTVQVWAREIGSTVQYQAAGSLSYSVTTQ